MTSPFELRNWTLAHGRSLALGPKALLMAVINVTPDSFSDGGLNADADIAIAHARQAVLDGATIIDIGGETTKPNAIAISEADEQARVMPVIEAVLEDPSVIVSIDTYRATTAERAVKAGAHIINDVTGLQGDPALARVVAETGAGIIIMHTGRNRTKLDDVVADQLMFFDVSLGIADAAGIARDRIMLDPGFGFAKETPEENFEVMARFEALFQYGLPVLAGASRKRFLGAATGRAPMERDVATAASSAIMRTMGAAVFRVHNVAYNKDALAVADAMLASKWKAEEKGPAG